MKNFFKLLLMSVLFVTATVGMSNADVIAKDHSKNDKVVLLVADQAEHVAIAENAGIAVYSNVIDPSNHTKIKVAVIGSGYHASYAAILSDHEIYRDNLIADIEAIDKLNKEESKSRKQKLAEFSFKLTNFFAKLTPINQDPDSHRYYEPNRYINRPGYCNRPCKAISYNRSNHFTIRAHLRA